jgi:hypothetical protein
MFVELATQSDNGILPLPTNFQEQLSNPFQSCHFTSEVNPFHQMRMPECNIVDSKLTTNAISTNDFQPASIYFDQPARTTPEFVTTGNNAGGGATNPLSNSMDVIQKNLKRGRADELSVVMPKEVLSKATCADLDGMSHRARLFAWFCLVGILGLVLGFIFWLAKLSLGFIFVLDLVFGFIFWFGFSFSFALVLVLVLVLVRFRF